MNYGSVSTGSHCEKIVFEDELGWECAFVSEIDKYANQVIRYHTDTPNLGDFSKIKANGETTRIDLLCGGTPCQDFSVAGLRAGLDGERGNLTLEFVKLADRLRPTWILWENVPGVLSLNGGRAFGAFLGGLAEIGYGFAYRILDAQYFGVHQRRRRVFVVGHLADWRRAAAVLFERESLSGHPPPSREAGARVAPTATGGPPFSRTGNERVEAEAMIPEISHAVTTREGRRQDHSIETPLPWQCHGSNVGPMGSLRAGNGNETGGVPFVADPIQVTSKENRSNPKPVDPSHTLHADAPILAFSCKDDGRDATEGLTPTLRSMGRQDGSPKCNGNGHMAVAFQAKQSASAQATSFDNVAPSLDVAKAGGVSTVDRMRVRRLLPIECERLQGWPDGWTEYGRTKAGGVVEISDTHRYKIIGNGWALPVVRWIGHRVDWIDAL